MDLKRKILTLIVILTFTSYFAKSYFIAAQVNGQIIWRLNVDQRLESRYGAQTLENMIIYTLLNQEAQKKHIAISQSEIDTEVKNEEKGLPLSGQTVERFLASQGETMDQFVHEATQNVLLQKLYENQMSVSDQEISHYLAKNKNRIPNWPENILKDSARQELRYAKIQNILQKLKDNSNILYFMDMSRKTETLSSHIL